MSNQLASDEKKALFVLLERFDLPVGDLAEIFASHLAARPARKDDLHSLRRALKTRGTQAQIEILERAGKLLSTEQMRERLGLASRQSVHNSKNKGELISISFKGRKGDYFPEFQLDGNQASDWVPQLLSHISDGWSALAFLTARRKDGKSFLTRILENPATREEMLAAAASYVD